MASNIFTDGEALTQLREVIEKLTGPDGCPWDREQTPESLADYLIEESHELAWAIRTGDSAQICNELGDLAFLLLFLATLYARKNCFSLSDALLACRDKMIRRHPHVYGESHFDTKERQLQAWEAIKRQEKKSSGDSEGLFATLPPSLPPLIKAYRINSKAARTGFTWPEDEEVEQQVEAEWLELLDARIRGDDKAQKHELGDVIFSLVEYGRRMGIKASEALELANHRFLRRYACMEKIAKSQGKDLTFLSLDEKDELWESCKKIEPSLDNCAGACSVSDKSQE